MLPAESRAGYTLGGLFLYARRARAYFARVLHGWAYLLALSIIGGALALIVSGHTALGCCALIAGGIATWVGEVWVIPWGDDAYARRVRHIVKTGTGAVVASSAVRRDHLRELRGAIVALEPPSQFTERHREVCEWMATLDSLDAGSGSVLEERAVRAHAILQQLTRTLEGLQKELPELYAVQLKHDIEQYLHGVADAQSAFQDVVEHTGESLRRVRPPGRRKASHQRYMATVDSYLVAIRNWRTTLNQDSDNEIRESATVMSVRRGELDKRTAEYLRELGDQYVGRHP
jgi:hypothetical protein